jgi:GT2 family glycosyltransferase
VVANRSDPETAAYLRALGPAVRVTALASNRGVGGGRNAGVALAAGELLLFLDDDAELADPGAIERATPHFEADPRLGALGMLVLDAATGAPDHACLPFRAKRVPARPTPACYFAGGACVVRRATFERVGPYDASLFYSGEELDLAYRMLDAGLRILFDPGIVVRHHREPGRDEDRTTYFNGRNRPWIALRHLPLRHCLAHCLAWWAWSLARGARHRHLGAAARAVVDCAAGMPAAWRSRRPLAPATLRILAAHGGRLWY